MTDPLDEELAWLDQVEAEKLRTLARLRHALAAGVVEYTDGRGLYAAVTPSLERPGGVRVTRYDARGFVGHRDTGDGPGELLDLGCTEPADGSLARMSRAWRQ
jgi:hypothetical protein